MGLFEKAGRRFEQFKKRAETAAEEEAEYACAACGDRLYADADRCPECGADAVTPIAEDDEESSAESAAAETDADAEADETGDESA
jgi:predicted  nucleic acid-binding Zn-ribbon protein